MFEWFFCVFQWQNDKNLVLFVFISKLTCELKFDIWNF
jgi:hypothetical protein